MYLVPGSTVSLRFYLKTTVPAKTFTVRLAAGTDRKADYTVQNPAVNRWVPMISASTISCGETLLSRGRAGSG
jgi:hypothetical protein